MILKIFSNWCVLHLPTSQKGSGCSIGASIYLLAGIYLELQGYGEKDA